MADPSGAASPGPVYAPDFPDPHVLRVESTYYAYATNVGGTNVQVISSPDLVSWTSLGDALPELPRWAQAGFTWAPEVCSYDGGYLLYYTVREPASGRQAISVAAGSRPEGPFVDRSATPLVFQLDRGGSIDPSPFVDGDDLYLFWKSDDNALHRPSALWGQRVTAGGLALTGEPTWLLSHDRPWERPLIEAPSMVRWGDTYFLFYSANWWESVNYAIGYATGSTPLGPFDKVTRDGPWVSSRGQAAGTGGQAFFTDADGELRMAYHAWHHKVGYANGGTRSLWVGRVRFVDGAPVLLD